MSFLLVMCLKHINYTGFSIITHGQNNSRAGTYRQNYAICRNRNRKLFNRWTMVGNIFYFKSAEQVKRKKAKEQSKMIYSTKGMKYSSLNQCRYHSPKSNRAMQRGTQFT